MAKNVQISQETFLKLVRYFCLDDSSVELYNSLKSDVEAKLDKIIAHENYTLYKTADSAETREEARQKYLDSKQIHKDFRW